MRIPLRTFQRNVQALLDTMSVNSAPWAEIVDGGGKVLFLAAIPGVIETCMRQKQMVADGDMPKNPFALGSEGGQVATTNNKALKFAELKRQMDARANPDASYRDDVYVPGAVEEPTHRCNKCKKPAACRKLVEDGMDYIVCEECAKKAKLNWNKLEKL